jgi:hypothetical protein
MRQLTENRLRSIIKEELLLREISRGSVLYHRSREELEPGQKLGGGSHGEGAHERKAEAEREFEEYRKNYASDKPSRYGAVFLSPTPKSRFNQMGDLYKMKLTGNYHIADSRMFDAYQSPWDYEVSQEGAIRCYWNPGSRGNCLSVRNVNPKYLEVVADEAVVIEKVGNDFVTEGDMVRVTESPPVPVQKGADGTSKDPEVWRQHPKIERVFQVESGKYQNFDKYEAELKIPSTWKVSYAQPHDTHRQQKRIRDRGGPGTNYAYSTYKRIGLQDGKVAPAYGGYNDSIEKLKFDEV